MNTNSKFEVFSLNQTADLTFVRPTVFMEGLYKFEVTSVGGTVTSMEVQIYTWSKRTFVDLTKNITQQWHTL